MIRVTRGLPPVAVSDLRARYGQMATDAMLRYLPDKEPRQHLYDHLPTYPLRGGRRFRPALCMATCRAFGGALESALPSAVAIEILHNAFLIHDDIEDESEERRGEPTLQRLTGVPVAINVGDAMTLQALHPLLDNAELIGPRLALRILGEIVEMARVTVEGQALELGWRRENNCDLAPADYYRMILKKTCAYSTIYPCRIGALIGSGGRVDPARLDRFGFFLGAVFQIMDDVENLVGDAHAYGKEIGGDLYEGKRTLMVIHLLEHANAGERSRIHDLLGAERDTISAGEVDWLRSLMDDYGSIEFARASYRGLAGAALREFEDAFAEVPQSEDREYVEGLIGEMLARDV